MVEGYLAADIGATKTLMAIFDSSGHLQKQVKFPTEQDYERFLEVFGQYSETLGSHFIAAGIDFPGTLDRNTNTLVSAGNLNWKNKAVQADFEKLLNCSVIIENDAKAAAVYEAKYLKDRYKKVLFLTIGTGIGIAIVEDGQLDKNFGDRGGSGLVVEHNGEQVPWESFASGKAIGKQFGKEARDINDEASWKTIANNLSVGINELVKSLKPDVIVIGGGVGVHLDKFAPFLKEALSNNDVSIPILRAQKPDEAGIYGSYELARSLDGSSA